MPDVNTPEKSNWLSRIFGRNVKDTTQSGQSAAHNRMMTAAEEFHRLRVEDVMVPRADMVCVEKDIGIHDLSIAFKDAGHSRLPVYKDTLDEPLGLIHIKDLLPYLMLNAKGRNGVTYKERKVAQSILRPVLYVPPSMLAEELISRMQARRIHMAIVVDEYGGTDGIVTLEDLVEQIVGNIEDEHDEIEVGLVDVTESGGAMSWEADARTPIDDFEEKLGRDFATPDEEDDVDTLGGLIFTLAGRIPERGEVIKHPDGLEFEVIDADARRIKRLRIRDQSKKKRASQANAPEKPPQNNTPPKS
ncbi:MAG: hemolysin family protein [Maricaulaceae bacterium]